MVLLSSILSSSLVQLLKLTEKRRTETAHIFIPKITFPPSSILTDSFRSKITIVSIYGQGAVSRF